jgi:hypothetical protein
MLAILASEIFVIKYNENTKRKTPQELTSGALFLLI